MTDEKLSKGTFGEQRLPTSKKYIIPPSRRKLLFWGALGVVVILLLLSLNFNFFQGTFLSNGPLSSSHAGMAGDCNSCHTEFKAVVSQKCSSCHETGGNALATFSFSAHYLYHTDDFQRDVPSDKEMPCSSCHQEHMGRSGNLTQVSDNRCLTCHNDHQFNSGHPAFAKASEPESGSLKFPHVAHVRELMKKHDLKKVEQACLSCHRLEADGAHFTAVNFDTDCDDCHLNSAEKTARLPIASGETVGVATLETIRARQEPGSRWALFANAGEYKTVGGRLVSKSPLHHRDPWVLENLRDLRKQIYPDGGLADLLQAGVQTSPEDLKSLYAEAIATLEGYAVELRSRPEADVQKELEKITQILEKAKRQLDDPYVILDETEFLLALQSPREDLSPETLAEMKTVANDLTEACQTCHVLDNFSIARVQKDQRAFTRANFNHGTHLLQRNCLDCHNKFPEGAFATENPPDVEMPATVQNLPDIDACRDCHTPKGASNDCITCHQFHPEQKQFSPLITRNP